MMGCWICKILHRVNEDALYYEFDLMGIAYLINQLTNKLRLGLLFNFGAEKFEMMRRIF